LAGHTALKQHIALVAAALGVVSPQLLAVGTVGGDLCQRPRCWYYRNGFGLLAQQDGKSLVRDGDNRYHAIFGNDGPALFVSPSSLGPALVALDASFTVAGPGGKTRKIASADFFRAPKTEGERETALKPNEILTAVFVPSRSLKNATYEVRHRHGLDWPYVTASVAYRLDGGKVADAKIVLGHVAPTPWIATAAAKALDGAAPTEIQAAKAADAAADGAKPLSGNAYKIQMVKAAVKRAILQAAS
jgi:xanthine dehydrogenase YagS FAD-binding subunit